MKVAGGEQRLAGGIDFSKPAPVLRIPEKLAVLNKVKITPQLGREVLSRFNPVFGQTTRTEGNVTLQVQNINMPLGERLGQGGSGSGRLILKDTMIEPEGLLGQLLELGSLGVKELYAVEIGGTDFQIKNGRIHYEDFTLSFVLQQFEMKFSGSVGFDDTLDLIVSIPVRPGLLYALGVAGPVLQYATALVDVRVYIPIGGTRDNPKLDFSKLDVGELIAKATGDVLKKGLTNPVETAVEGVTKPVEDVVEGVTDLLTGEKDKDDGKKATAPKKSPDPKKKGADPKADPKKETSPKKKPADTKRRPTRRGGGKEGG
jgi:hypothetical protein